MKPVRYVAGVVLLTAFIACAGCGSKKEKDVAAVPGPSPQKPAAVAVAPQEKAEVSAVAAKVLTQFKSGEFAAIYKAASSGFKEIGTEDGFVATMEHTRKKTGAIKDVKEVNFVTSPDKFYFIVYHVQYDNIKSELRLSFGRSKSGVMELCGLNQKDIIKKK